MKRLSYLLLLLAPFPATPGHSQDGPRLFRSIPLRLGQIELGTRFTLMDEISDPIDDSTAALRPGTFGGAETIRVRLGPERVVRALLFEYAADTDFPAKVQEYVDYLGQPTERRDSGPAGSSVIWSDGRTLFELGWEQRPSGGRRYYTVMRDLAGT
jgi:hypothetical protein